MQTYKLDEIVIKETIRFLFGQDVPENFVARFSGFLEKELEDNFGVFFVLHKLNKKFRLFMSQYPSMSWGNKGVSFFRGILSCYADYHKS